MMLAGTATVLAGCPETLAPRFDRALTNEFEEIVKAAVERDVPGLVAGVWVEDAGTWTVAKGLADLETGEAVALDSLFRVGSITKTFTATVVLQLAEEKQLYLDSTVSLYRQDVPNGGRISIEMLLNHTSGLPEYTNGVEADEGVLDEPLHTWTTDELLAMAFAQEPVSEPGARFGYTNTNYVLLGLIIEAVTGNTVAAEIHSRIIAPLHMTDTFFAEGALLPEGAVRGYQAASENEWVDVTETNASLVGAAGALVSSLRDMRLWARALGEGDLLGTATQEARLEAVRLDGEDIYGLGIALQDGFVGHNGAVPGFNAECRYWPEKKATIVVLQNALGGETGAGDIYNSLREVLFSEKDRRVDSR